MSTKKLKGIFTALVTPFNEDLSVDFSAFNTLLKAQVDGGIHGLVIGGTTGESPTLSEDERFTLLEKTLEFVAGRIPVIIGVGSNDTAQALAMNKRAENYPVAAIMQTVPWYNKPTQEGLYQHFRLISQHSNRPILMYNVPGRTGTDMSVATVIRLAKECPNIIGIKDAHSNSLRTVQITSQLQTLRPDFCVLSGEDSELVPTLAAGGDGVISVISNVAPKEVVSFYDNCLKVPVYQLTWQYQKLLALTELMFSCSNPLPAKTALAHLGLIKGPYFRLPLCPIASEARQELESKIQSLKLECSNG